MNRSVLGIARWTVALMMAILAFGGRPALGASPATLFDGDPRTAAKYSFRFLNMPMRDVLADINQQTGIAFYSDQAIADNRLSLIVHDRPLSEILQGIATFYRWEWRRDELKNGTKRGAGYTLSQSAEVKREAETFADERLKSLAAILSAECGAFSQLSPLDQKQRERLESEIPTLVAQEKDPEKLLKLRVQSVVLQDLRERRMWKPPIYRLLASLAPERLNAITHSAATSYAWPTIPGCEVLPSDRVEELKQILMQEFVPAGAPRGQIISLRIRFTLVAGRQPYLRTSLQVGQHSNYGFSSYGTVAAMPSAYTLLSQEPDSKLPLAPANWSTDPKMAAVASLKVTVDADKQAAAVNQSPPGPPGFAQSLLPGFWLTDALDKLGAASHIDSISDGLWTTRIAGIDITNLPLGEILTRLARATGHRWWIQDGFVMMQSQSLNADRWAEPPATSVERWRDAIDQGSFRLDDYAEMASLPDAQVMTLQQMSIAEQFPLTPSPLNGARPQLLLWNGLSPALRRKALGSGLGYTDLSPQQQQLFVLAATDPGASPQSAAVPDERFLAQSRLRVETQERPCWGIHRAGPFSTWRIPRGPDPDSSIVKREDAIHRFQASDSSIRAQDVQPMTLVVHSFIFENAQEPLSRALIQLPPRWESE